MNDTWLAIGLAAVGTYLMRAAFLLTAHRLTEVPPALQRLLRQIPPAALASIVALAILRPDDALDLWQPELAAGALAAVVSWRTRSAVATLLVGMGVVVALRQL